MHRDRVKRRKRLRTAAQLSFAALFNGYFAGFAKGRIFTGPSKGVCVPVLNCYSCPGALGACPIGSLQSVAGGRGRSVSFYVLGALMLLGVVFGRLICGFACPFGFLQDMAARLPVRKLKIPERADRLARRIKYLMLAAVLILPAAVSAAHGIASPYFCKYFCPAGTLEGGLPLLLANDNLRQMAGAIFTWKFFILVAVITGSVLVERFFCRYFCPLGAAYSLFNRFAFYRMELDSAKCVSCGRCEAVCPMAVKVTEDINGAECIRCGKCRDVCPTDAIRSGFSAASCDARESKAES